MTLREGPTRNDEPNAGKLETASTSAYEPALVAKECNVAKYDFQRIEERQTETGTAPEEANDSV